jgi:hypothetical protein
VSSTMHVRKVQAVCFDVGNVLVEIDIAYAIARLGLPLAVSHSPKPPENALRKSVLDCRLASSVLSRRKRAGDHDL